MPTEAGRHHLYETVKHAWGQDDADELMSLLPPVGWADVATKQDLAHLEARLDAKIDVKFAALDVRFAEIDVRFAEIDVRFAELDGKFAELDTTIAGLDGSQRVGLSDLRAEMHAGFRRQTAWMVGAMVGLTAMCSAVVTIAR